MKINIRYEDSVVILDISGEIDINSSTLIETIGDLLKKGISKIIINLNDVNFIDYNGLSVLAIAYKSVLNGKSIVKLTHVPLHIMELLRIVKLDNVFSIYKNIDKALESFETKEKPSGDEDQLEQPLRRRFQRLGMDLSAYYRKSNGKENPLYSGLADNISGAGLFLRGINILPAGTKVDLDIVLSETKKCVSVKGIIVWLADKQLQPDFYPGMGVQFLNFDAKKQEELLGFIERQAASS